MVQNLAKMAPDPNEISQNHQFITFRAFQQNLHVLPLCVRLVGLYRFSCFEHLFLHV